MLASRMGLRGGPLFPLASSATQNLSFRPERPDFVFGAVYARRAA